MNDTEKKELEITFNEKLIQSTDTICTKIRLNKIIS